MLQLVTSSFNNKNTPFLISNFKGNKKVKILITRPNHRLGNQLLLSPLIQEIKNQIPNSQIDLLVNGTLSKMLYQNYDYICEHYNLPLKPFSNFFTYLRISLKLIRKKYDIGISGCEDSNSSKIFLKLSRCKHKIFDSGVFKIDAPLHIAKYPIYNFVLNQKESKKNTINYPKIDLKLSADEMMKGDKKIQELFSSNKQVIAIFTYATGEKKLSKKWWQSFYDLLKNEFINYEILEILPKENVSQIDFKSVYFYSNNLREIASVIEKCELFIGSDSGMMHLATSTSTTTIGLFNITNPRVYEPYGNDNISVLSNQVKQTDIIKIIENKLVRLTI